MKHDPTRKCLFENVKNVQTGACIPPCAPNHQNRKCQNAGVLFHKRASIIYNLQITILTTCFGGGFRRNIGPLCGILLHDSLGRTQFFNQGLRQNTKCVMSASKINFHNQFHVLKLHEDNRTIAAMKNSQIVVHPSMPYDKVSANTAS